VRNVVLAMQQSLDGFIAGPGGETDWIGPGISADVEQVLCEHLESADTMLMGRVTYEEQRAVWPRLRGRMADVVNGHRKLVFSRTLHSVDWSGAELAWAAPAEVVEALKGRSGGTIAVSGGPGLVRALLAAGLIDEFLVTTHPRTLGGGIKLFREPGRLSMVSTAAFASGATVARYALSQTGPLG
jgi:dihydrofolate reductase